MKHLTYLAIDACCILVPLLASFHPKTPFFKTWGRFWPVNAAVAAGFLLWDQAFAERGIWGFSDERVIGFCIGKLPIEEALFFVCIPYACSYTFFALRLFLKKNPLRPYARRLAIGLAVATGAVALLHLDRAYTAAAMGLCSAILAFLVFEKADLADLFVAYAAVFPFFLLSNGLLTGSWLDAPIVWYDDRENLGLRIGTIPVEDVFYGFALIALNVRFAFLRREDR